MPVWLENVSAGVVYFITSLRMYAVCAPHVNEGRNAWAARCWICGAVGHLKREEQ